MSDKQKPLVSAEELEALIQGWGATPAVAVDRFYPLRCWILALIALAYAIALLFNTQAVAQTLSSQAVEVERMARFLYFRGWFLSLMLCIGVISYLQNRYLALVQSGFLLIGSVNFVFDLFNLYAEVLSQAAAQTTLAMIVRLLALGFLYLNVRHSSRLPSGKDRFNPLLAFRARS